MKIKMDAGGGRMAGNTFGGEGLQSPPSEALSERLFNGLKDGTRISVNNGSIGSELTLSPQALDAFITDFSRVSEGFISGDGSIEGLEKFAIALDSYKNFLTQLDSVVETRGVNGLTNDTADTAKKELFENTQKILSLIAGKMAHELTVHIMAKGLSSIPEDKRKQLKQFVEELQNKYGERIKKKWSKLITGPIELLAAVLDGKKIIFLGGSSNNLDENGIQQRGKGRDFLSHLIQQDGDMDGDGFQDDDSIVFYDPQIHEETHGRGYNFSVDGPTEALARDLSAVNVYEIGNRSLSIVTMMEIICDVAKGKKIVFWMDDRFIPVEPNTKDGKETVNQIIEKHIAVLVKAEKDARNYFMKFVNEFNKVTARKNPVIVEYTAEEENDLKNRKRKPWFDENKNLVFDIYPDRFSADVLIRALMRIAEDLPTKVVFHGTVAGKENDDVKLKGRIQGEPHKLNYLEPEESPRKRWYEFYKKFGGNLRIQLLRWHNEKHKRQRDKKTNIANFALGPKDAFNQLKKILREENS